jgi:hypothetical protein
MKIFLWLTLFLIIVIYGFFEQNDAPFDKKNETQKLCTCPCYSSNYISNYILKDGKYKDVGEFRRFLRDHCK